jgi:serine/threonine protein phosphatase 1
MRLLAIGDIHGCTAAFDALLKAVAPRAGDQIVTLGDYVDRGPDSRGILDRLIAMHAKGNLVALRGNHDWMMARALEEPWAMADWLGCGGQAAVDSYGSLEEVPATHRHFLEHDCVDWYEADRHFFVHASVDPNLALEDQPTYMLHWEKIDRWTPAHLSGKVMVCGHTAQKGGVPLNIGHAVCIDTYCYGGGWLTCLDVESGQYWQANQKGETRKRWSDVSDD